MNDDQKQRARHSSVGIVPPRFAHFTEPLELDSGQTLEQFTLAYETYGTLNAERTNAIWLCHALSGDAHVAGYHTDDPNERPGWWDEAVGPGRMFDTEQFFVICSNVLGGCRGSTGPSSLAPDGKPYGARFPLLTVADMVRAQIRLLDELGIERLYAVGGGSMGAMQALQWALAVPERVGSVLFIAATPQSSAQNIALNEIGRQAIYADPHWNGGDYYEQTSPNAGLAVARMVGHVSYMSDGSLARKFGRARSITPELYTLNAEFEVESYLRYQGKKFVQRFDAGSYVIITKALDYFDVSAGHASLAEALRQVQCPVLAVSFSSDWLYPPTQMRWLVEALKAADKEVEHHHIIAEYGHDSFLVEVEKLTEIVGGFLTRLNQSAPNSYTPLAFRWLGVAVA